MWSALRTTCVSGTTPATAARRDPRAGTGAGTPGPRCASEQQARRPDPRPARVRSLVRQSARGPRGLLASPLVRVAVRFRGAGRSRRRCAAPRRIGPSSRIGAPAGAPEAAPASLGRASTSPRRSGRLRVARRNRLRGSAAGRAARRGVRARRSTMSTPTTREPRASTCRCELVGHGPSKRAPRSPGEDLEAPPRRGHDRKPHGGSRAWGARVGLLEEAPTAGRALAQDHAGHAQSCTPVVSGRADIAGSVPRQGAVGVHGERRTDSPPTAAAPLRALPRIKR